MLVKNEYAAQAGPREKRNSTWQPAHSVTGSCYCWKWSYWLVLRREDPNQLVVIAQRQEGAWPAWWRKGTTGPNHGTWPRSKRDRCTKIPKRTMGTLHYLNMAHAPKQVHDWEAPKMEDQLPRSQCIHMEDLHRNCRYGTADGKRNAATVLTVTDHRSASPSIHPFYNAKTDINS